MKKLLITRKEGLFFMVKQSKTKMTKCKLDYIRQNPLFMRIQSIDSMSHKI